MVAPPEEADSDAPCVVPVRGFVEAPVVSGFAGLTCPSGNVDGIPPVPETATPEDSTVVTIGVAGIAPSDGIIPPAALARAAAGDVLVEAEVAPTTLVATGVVGVGSAAGTVGGAAFEVATGADTVGSVITDDTMGVSAWKRSTALTISFSASLWAFEVWNSAM
jgi:hypothetical protein